QFERSLMLQTLDHHWREHLSALDHLRQGIHLRGYAQKNPKQEYKREAFELFSDMLDRIKADVVKVVLTVQVRTQEDVQAVEEAPPVSNVKYQHAGYDEALASAGGGNGDTPVAICRAHLNLQHARSLDFRALVINAGNANAGTGEAGFEAARTTCVSAARLIDCAPEQVLPFSTGVIMEPLPVERVVAGLPSA